MTRTDAIGALIQSWIKPNVPWEVLSHEAKVFRRAQGLALLKLLRGHGIGGFHAKFTKKHTMVRNVAHLS